MKRFLAAYFILLWLCLPVVAENYATEGDIGSSHVRNIQTILKENGYYTGELDGNFDASLASSLRTLYEDHGRELTEGTVTADDWLWLLSTNLGAEEEEEEPEEDLLEDPLYRNLAIGSIIPFGKFKGETISWLVLKIEEGRALLVAEDGIIDRPFHYTPVEIQWEDSTLFKWLNEDLIKSAFKVWERDRILSSFFLLDDKTARGIPFTHKTWLGVIQGDTAAVIDEDGIIMYEKLNSRRSVRPAFWLDTTIDSRTTVCGVNSVNLRIEPDDFAETLGMLSSGERVILLERGNVWSLVSVDGVRGYVRTKYLQR